MRIFKWAILAGFVGMASSQPATVTLRAKLRDFKDYIATDSTTHPDFENDAYLECGGENLGYVKSAIGLTDPVDTSLFRGDNRDPILQKLNNPSTAKPCFTGLDKFHDWYNDVPSVNRSFYVDLVLTRNAQGVYTYNNDKFLPLNAGAGFQKFHPTDPDPFGPRPEINLTDVWGFTMELHTQFTYTAGKGQVFSFKGDDDVWVFINGQLAIDLGGLHSALSATVNLDTKAASLGLVDGGSYPLDFFFAERHSTGSHCQITTSLELLQKPALPVPVVTLPSQTFQSSVQVALSVPGHPEAQIRYTVDGSEPTESSPLYSAAINVTATTTLKAKGFQVDYADSPVMTDVYTLQSQVLPPPVADPTSRRFTDSLAVRLSVPGHPDAQIRYTVDGSVPTAKSPLYSAAINLTATTTLKAKAFQATFVESTVMTDVYTLQPPEPPAPQTLPTPVTNLPGSNFKDTLRVSLSVPGQGDVQIHYTLDGSNPTATSPVYKGPLIVTGNVTVKAIAVKTDWVQSGVMTETYTLIAPPNVVSLHVERAVTETQSGSGIQSMPGLKRPVALITLDRGIARCLACEAGSESVVLGPGQFPEWVTVSRDPFHYQFQIYDNIGNFVVEQSGEVSREVLNQTLGDSAGYHALRFRWIPVAADGQLIGTGAYILRANVISQALDARNVPIGVATEASLLKTLGFVRK